MATPNGQTQTAQINEVLGVKSVEDMSDRELLEELVMFARETKVGLGQAFSKLNSNPIMRLLGG